LNREIIDECLARGKNKIFIIYSSLERKRKENQFRFGIFLARCHICQEHFGFSFPAVAVL
jgi:hypothetical protein